MGSVRYVEIRCRSALNRVQGMPFRWSLNPYIGCGHACRYCYAREYYALAEHGSPGRDFETNILGKINFADVLRRELARRALREQVALGTSTDCYQPAEGRFRLIRRSLELLLEHRLPMGLVTKSLLVLRDVDVLADLSRVAGAHVCFTITTMDPDLWRVLEPGTAHPLKRLQVLRRLREAGVNAGVLMAPVLPGVTDSVASIEAVASAAREHGAAFFHATPLRLMPRVKQEYFGFVATAFPDLLPRYERAYPSAHAPALSIRSFHPRGLSERERESKGRLRVQARSI